MNILLLNPNTSTEMTEHIAREAGRYCAPGNAVRCATAVFGAPVIASRASYAIAAHAVLDTYARCIGECGTSAPSGETRTDPPSSDPLDAVIIACFGDPGLEALREVAAIPVIGLLESAIDQAVRGDRPFGIVTAGPAWVAMLDERIRLGSHAALSRAVVAIDTTGLDVTRDPDRFVDELQAAVDEALRSGAEAVILGGSALAGFGARLSTDAGARAGLRLIDPLEAAMARAQDAVRGPLSSVA